MKYSAECRAAALGTPEDERRRASKYALLADYWQGQAMQVESIRDRDVRAGVIARLSSLQGMTRVALDEVVADAGVLADLIEEARQKHLLPPEEGSL